MPDFAPGRASASVEAAVPAGAFFDAVADWLGFMEVSDPDAAIPFSHVTCAPGSQPGVLPLTRLLHVDKSGEGAEALPDHFAETLLAADPETGTLVYRVEGAFLGMRNYYAVEEIVPIGADRCRVTISSRFDLPAGADPRQAAEPLEEAYRSMIRGVEIAVERRANS